VSQLLRNGSAEKEETDAIEVVEVEPPSRCSPRFRLRTPQALPRGLPLLRAACQFIEIATVLFAQRAQEEHSERQDLRDMTMENTRKA
jgi:hypothetical protein